MGTKYSSSNKNASLYIDMPRSQYTVGGAISGVVQMLVKKPFQPVTLNLLIYGEEQTYWQTQSSNNRYQAHSGSRIHIEHVITLETYHDQVMPGLYKIPFAFLIPKGLPASFYWNSDIYWNTDAWARIQYKMIAVLKLPEKQMELRFDRIFTVANANDFPQVPEEKYVENKKKVLQLGCFSRGQAKLASKLYKNGLHADQQISTQLFIDNQHCSATIKKIQFFLRQKIVIRSCSGKTQGNICTLAQKDFPGLGKRQSLQQGELRILELDLKKFINDFLAERKTKIKKDYKKFANFFLQTTTHSQYIDCSYFIVIRPLYDFLCQFYCSSVPTIIHPIILGRSRKDPIDLLYARPKEFTVYEGVPIIQEIPQEAYPVSLITQGYVQPPVFNKKFGQNQGLMQDYYQQQRIHKGVGRNSLRYSKVRQAPKMSNFDINQEQEDDWISRIRASQNLDTCSNDGMHFNQ